MTLKFKKAAVLLPCLRPALLEAGTWLQVSRSSSASTSHYVNQTPLRYKHHLVYLWKLTLKPPNFCHYNIVQRVFKANKENRSYKHTVGIVEWSPHTENCNVCVQFNKIKKGGRPKKLKLGRPPSRSKICCSLHQEDGAGKFLQ